MIKEAHRFTGIDYGRVELLPAILLCSCFVVLVGLLKFFPNYFALSHFFSFYCSGIFLVVFATSASSFYSSGNYSLVLPEILNV